MRAAHSIALLALSGCAFAPNLAAYENRCITDNDCRGGLVCFADGCGDPGTGIVVEVTGDNTGLHPQDFAIPQGATATMNLDLRGPLTLSGKLEKQSDDNTGLLEYTDGVTITAKGKSDLIPGIVRSYSLVLPRAEQAAYQMFIGAGTYTVTARAADLAIPYERTTVTVAPGTIAGASFTFPAPKNSLPLTGRLVKTKMPTMTFQSGMQIQAFDSVGGTAYSQAVPVSAMGDFQLYVDSEAQVLTSLTLVASPREGNVLVPTKTFVLTPVPQGPTSLGDLELGDFGAALVGVKGTLVSSEGKPLANALVNLGGRVNGDGTFQTPKVVTDAAGVFTVDVLASAPGGSFTLTAVPPSGSPAGILTTQVRATLVSGKPTLLVGGQPKDTFTCPDRLKVSGTVLRPNGGPAKEVLIEATPVEAIDQQPLPDEVTRTATNVDGQFELFLDPARYRFDYIPTAQGSERLPRKSRYVRIEPEITPDAGVSKTAPAGTFSLSEGRTIAGAVTVRPNTIDTTDGGFGTPGVPVPNALVRFYRVTAVEGVDSALLIGESFSDDRGNYSVVLPAAR